MQTIFTTGALGSDAVTRQAGRDDVTSFSVASNQGYGENKTTIWFRCSIWGKRGTSLAPYLLKGGKVALSGELEIGEYDGKPQYNIRVNEIDLMGGNERKSDGKSGGSMARHDTRQEPADALDDNVPFILMEGKW